MKTWNVIVIGGGPAGLMAAARAAELGRRVLLIEKNRALGKKLRITGGGRCNITHAEFDPRVFLSYFGDGAKFLYSPFARFAVQETFDFFAERGLPLMIEEDKRVFPATQTADDVVRVLETSLRENGVDIYTNTSVIKLHLDGNRVVGVETTQGLFNAESVILATGGTSYPSTGSTGDGLNWLRALGHTVHPATPDLVPLRTAEPWVKSLSGMTLGPVEITFTSADCKPESRCGEILFTHFGLSGPLILNCSHEVEKLLQYGPVTAQINLFPGKENKELDRLLLDQFNTAPNRQLRNAVRQFVPSGMAGIALLHLPEELLEKKVHSVTLEERKTIVHQLRHIMLTITGTMGLDWAIVSSGGIDPTEIDTRTMVSRLISNLYPIGDLLAIRRPTGGYSLQLCWTTGWAAGESA